MKWEKVAARRLKVAVVRRLEHHIMSVGFLKMMNEQIEKVFHNDQIEL